MDGWQKARVLRARQGAEDIRVLTLAPEHPAPHKAGQNYELRLFDGSDARMFSVISPPSRPEELDFGVQLVSGGLVSPGLYKLQAGDKLAIRGPHGRLFAWNPAPGPLVLIGGGSGILPLISIYDQYRALYPEGKALFIVSAKSAAYVYDYRRLKDVLITRFTGDEPRIDQSFLQQHAGGLAFLPGVQCYVCGPAKDFIEHMTNHLLTIGFTADSIRTERYY